MLDSNNGRDILLAEVLHASESILNMVVEVRMASSVAAVGEQRVHCSHLLVLCRTAPRGASPRPPMPPIAASMTLATGNVFGVATVRHALLRCRIHSPRTLLGTARCEPHLLRIPVSNIAVPLCVARTALFATCSTPAFACSFPGQI